MEEEFSKKFPNYRLIQVETSTRFVICPKDSNEEMHLVVQMGVQKPVNVEMNKLFVENGLAVKVYEEGHIVVKGKKYHYAIQELTGLTLDDLLFGVGGQVSDQEWDHIGNEITRMLNKMMKLQVVHGDLWGENITYVIKNRHQPQERMKMEWRLQNLQFAEKCTSQDKDIVGLARNMCVTEAEYLRKYWWPEWLGEYGSLQLQRELTEDLDFDELLALHEEM